MDASPRSHGLPLLALGFRPFYLLACIYAALSVPLWIARYRGWIAFDGYLDGLTWHAHEFIFGFAAAVISGFLLTAPRNWTGQQTPTGAPLGALALLWIAGRVLCFTGPAGAAAVVDLLFLPCVAIALAVPILRTRNSNGYVLIVIGLLTLVNLLIHLDQLGIASIPLPDTADLALDVISILMVTIAGRVAPLFIGNRLPDANPRRHPVIDITAVGSLVALLAIDVVGLAAGLPGPFLVVFYTAAAAMHLIRVGLWSPGATLREPLLWILPLSYAWIPLWLLLRGAATLGWAPDVVHHHALAIGAMASLMLGMMTRSALGHTGRELRAGIAETAAFVLIQLAVLLRIVPLVLFPEVHAATLVLSAGCWTAAFVVVLLKYGPMLVRPRVDGKPG